MKLQGVDISEMNGSVDFSSLKKAGIKFVIIRCGYGSDYPGQQDTEFESNVAKANKYNIPYGVYHYSYARDAAGGRAEAAHVLRLLKGRKPEFGVWFDMEDKKTIGGDLAGAADAFCSTIEKAGCFAGVYASLFWWETHLISPIFNKYGKWVAQYFVACNYQQPYGIWQYSDSGVIGGKEFDMNIAYIDYSGGLTYDQWKTYKAKYENERAAHSECGWASNAIDFCKDSKIMSGDSDGRFRPNSEITRQEIAQVAKNLFELVVTKDED